MAFRAVLRTKAHWWMHGPNEVVTTVLGTWPDAKSYAQGIASTVWDLQGIGKPSGWWSPYHWWEITREEIADGRTEP